MKKTKIILLSIALLSLTTGCGSKDLKCSYKNDSGTSDFVASFNGDKVLNMELTTELFIDADKENYKQQVMAQLKQKTQKVYQTENGIKAIFDMGSDYFNSLGLSKDASYSELKQMLEIEGYTCESK